MNEEGEKGTGEGRTRSEVQDRRHRKEWKKPRRYREKARGERYWGVYLRYSSEGNY